MKQLAWNKLYGVIGDALLEVVEVEGVPVEGGFVVRSGCFREFVEAGKLFHTRAEAESRLAELGLQRRQG